MQAHARLARQCDEIDSSAGICAMATYDAFISYVGVKDKPIAAALQSFIQRMGKPWYRRRGVRIFRDDTSLSTITEAWPVTEKALSQSRFFILLASPEAAASKSIVKQVAYWLDHNSIDTLLLAVTDGELEWSDLPDEVRQTRNARLPISLDLRGYRDCGNTGDAQFLEAATYIAATIHGITKKELMLQQLRQQRRMLNLTCYTAISLLALAVTAGWGLKGALKSERDAIEQRQAAERQRWAAEKQTERAERNAGLAHETMDAVLSNITDDLRNLEGMKLDMAREVLARIEAALGTLVTRTGNTPEMLRRQTAMYRQISSTYLSFGDFPHAVDYARKQTAISRELAARNPARPEWQHDLAISLNHEGEVLRRQGDYKAARADFREALSIGRQIASKDPQSLLWRANVVASLRGIGDVLVAQGDISGALTVYREGLAIDWALVARAIENDKSSTAANDQTAMRWQIDLIGDLDRIGDFFQSQGDTEATLSAYRLELELGRKFAGTGPNNPKTERQIAVVLTKLGFVYGSQGDFSTSIAQCGEAADVTRALIGKDQNNSELQMDLVASLHCLARAGDKPRDRWTEALAILSQLQSEQRIPPAKQGWIASVKRDLRKSERMDVVPKPRRDGIQSMGVNNSHQ
jgi:tetratricopeptide (TPR) repeat protein